MGRGTASRFGEAFSMSGILKILESVLVFVTLLIHRHGDNGKYIFFATARDRLKFNDPDRQAIDAENLGNGTLVTYAIISPVLLACYVLDGRYAIQSMFLEWFWNLLGAGLFAGVGVKTCINWSKAKQADDHANVVDYARDYDAALAMGALCLILSVIYFVDFLVALSVKRRINSSPY